MTPSNHSSEAIAAYPYGRGGRDLTSERTAFDAGVATTHARQYAAKRDELIAAIDTVTRYQDEATGRWMNEVDSDALADALLATPGPLLDAGEVWLKGCAAGNAFTVLTINQMEANNPYREAHP